MVAMLGRGVWLGSCLQVVLGGGVEGVEAGPGEPADESFVDVGEPGVGEVVPLSCVKDLGQVLSC